MGEALVLRESEQRRRQRKLHLKINICANGSGVERNSGNERLALDVNRSWCKSKPLPDWDVFVAAAVVTS